MAAAARTRGDRGAAQAPASDVYVGLLGISLVALILGCVLLALDWREYPETKPPPAPQYSGLPQPPAGGQPVVPPGLGK